MTKKHFIALADMFKTFQKSDLPTSGLYIKHDDVVSKVADFCAAQNPQFNRERWLGYIAGENGQNGGRR